MEKIKQLLKEREDYLLQLKNEKQKELTNVPEGSLRICCSENRVQYYQRKEAKDFRGVYIREKDAELARRLAQRDYDEKILKSIEQELLAIKRYFSGYPQKVAEHIYQEMHQERRKLVTPIIETREEFINNWQNRTYQGKEIDATVPEIFTAKGERVRSKSELIIADILKGEGVPYHYEFPLYLNGFGRIYPDFTVLNIETRTELYWEHFGMMDDINYVEKAMNKLSWYEKNGIFPGKNLIITYETKKNPIDQKIIRAMIHQYLK